MDVAHPLGDFSFRRVPSDARQPDLIIHQLKYPHDDVDVDINVIFPIERLQDLAAEGVIGGLTKTFFSFIGHNVDPERLLTLCPSSGSSGPYRARLPVTCALELVIRYYR
jgi:D-proline reductase (dithiol) PrdB